MMEMNNYVSVNYMKIVAVFEGGGVKGIGLVEATAMIEERSYK